MKVETRYRRVFTLPAGLERAMALDHIGLVQRVYASTVYKKIFCFELVRHGIALLLRNSNRSRRKKCSCNWLRWSEQKMKLLNKRFEVMIFTIDSVK